MLWLYKETNGANVYLWKVEESAAFFAHRLQLSDAEWQALTQKFSHVEALMHWLSSRYLLKQVLGDEDYAQLATSPTGKLYLPHAPQRQFSISHSEQVVALALADRPVGIDIQRQTDRLARIAAKFIPEAQLARLRADAHFNEQLHLHWTTKEALFKAYGQGGLDFRQHLLIPDQTTPAPAIDFDCWIEKTPEPVLHYRAHVEKLDDYWLSVVVLCD